jgi:hypothetical protein
MHGRLELGEGRGCLCVSSDDGKGSRGCTSSGLVTGRMITPYRAVDNAMTAPLSMHAAVSPAEPRLMKEEGPDGQ